MRKRGQHLYTLHHQKRSTTCRQRQGLPKLRRGSSSISTPTAKTKTPSPFILLKRSPWRPFLPQTPHPTTPSPANQPFRQCPRHWLSLQRRPPIHSCDRRQRKRPSRAHLPHRVQFHLWTAILPKVFSADIIPPMTLQFSRHRRRYIIRECVPTVACPTSSRAE